MTSREEYSDYRDGSKEQGEIEHVSVSVNDCPIQQEPGQKGPQHDPDYPSLPIARHLPLPLPLVLLLFPTLPG